MLHSFFQFIWSSPVNLACYALVVLFLTGMSALCFIRMARIGQDRRADRDAIMARRRLPWHQRDSARLDARLVLASVAVKPKAPVV